MPGAVSAGHSAARYSSSSCAAERGEDRLARDAAAVQRHPRHAGLGGDAARAWRRASRAARARGGRRGGCGGRRRRPLLHECNRGATGVDQGPQLRPFAIPAPVRDRPRRERDALREVVERERAAAEARADDLPAPAREQLVGLAVVGRARAVAARVAQRDLRVQLGRHAGGGATQAQLEVLEEQERVGVERAQPAQRVVRAATAAAIAQPTRRRRVGPPGSASQPQARGAAGAGARARARARGPSRLGVRAALDASRRRSAAAGPRARRARRRASTSPAQAVVEQLDVGIEQTVTGVRTCSRPGDVRGAEPGVAGQAHDLAPCRSASAAPPSAEPESTTTSSGAVGRWRSSSAGGPRGRSRRTR